MTTAMDPDPRCRPVIHLDEQRLAALVAPFLHGDEVADVATVEGGLVNTLYRVRSRGGMTLCVRLFASGPPSWRREQAALALVAPAVPAPQVLTAIDDPLNKYPYSIYRWIDGMTLNECRRQDPSALGELAKPLGELAATVAAAAGVAGGRPDVDVGAFAAWRIGECIPRAQAQLRDHTLRGRLDSRIADALSHLLQREFDEPQPLDLEPCLVHGDFSGRNILVYSGPEGRWQVSGVIDWEFAAIGPWLWDVGSLFRYGTRYSASFRNRFADGYHAAGGRLPDNWCRRARLLDAVRLVDLLVMSDELPVLFGECRGLLTAVVEEWQPA